MLADDPLGGGRERIEDPLPQSYFMAFEQGRTRSRTFNSSSPRTARALVVGLPAALHPAGAESRRAPRAVCSRTSASRSHCRSRGIGEQMVQWAVAEAQRKGCKLVELLTHHTRVDAQRFYERLGFARSHVGMTVRF